MKKEILAISIGLLLSLVDIISFSLTKYIFNHKSTLNLLWLSIPFLFYGSQIGLFYYGLKYSTMAELNIVWNILSSFLVTFVGYYLFKEKISNMKMIAIALGIVSLLLFTINDK
jgi:multidrug transporter EmrE-like cation transporter